METREQGQTGSAIELRANDPSHEELWEALKRASDAMDVRALNEAVRRIDWSRRTGDEFEEAVHLALMGTAHFTGEQLCAKGIQLYPDHPGLKKKARIFEPPRVIGTRPADPSSALDTQWIREHWHEHRGRCIALRKGKLIAEAPTMKELLDQVELDFSTFITRIA